MERAYGSSSSPACCAARCAARHSATVAVSGSKLVMTASPVLPLFKHLLAGARALSSPPVHHRLDLAPSREHLVERIAVFLLAPPGRLPTSLVHQRLDLLPKTAVDHVRLQRVQLPALIAGLALVVLEPLVALLRGVRRRPVLSHLIHVEGEAPNLDGDSHEQVEAVVNVPGHVEAGRVVITEVKHDRLEAEADKLLELLGAGVRLAQRVVATAGEERDVPIATGGLDQVNQG